jgi:hypothetical protein
MFQVTYLGDRTIVVLSSANSAYTTIVLYLEDDTLIGEAEEGGRDVTLFFEIQKGELVFVATTSPECAQAQSNVEMVWPWVKGYLLTH